MVGDVVRLTHLQATVLETGPMGVRRVALRFAPALDDPALWFLAWKDGRLQHVPPPQPGEALLLPWVRAGTSR